MIGAIILLLFIDLFFWVPLASEKSNDPCGALVSIMATIATSQGDPPPPLVSAIGTPIVEAAVSRRYNVPAFLGCTALYWKLKISPNSIKDFQAP
jgi:hypothetical protein